MVTSRFLLGRSRGGKGLIDTHAHLAFDASANPGAALAARDDNAALAAMNATGRTALHAGSPPRVTSATATASGGTMTPGTC